MMPQASEHDPAIRAAVEDYALGWLDGDPARMDRCLHPALAKRAVADPRTGRLDLIEATKDEMIEEASTPKPFGRDLRIDIHAVDDTVASASVRSEPYLDLVHLAKFDDRWLLVNALWEHAPTSPASLESEAGVRRALRDYAEFPFERDVVRARRCHHPELRERRQVVPGSPDLALEETVLDEVLTIAAEGFDEEPAPREATTVVLDMTATAASARMDIAWWQIHLHLAAFADGWRIVNILYRTKDTL